MTATNTANALSFQEYLFQLPESILENSEHTDYLTAEALNLLAKDIERQLTKGIEQRELLPVLQPAQLTDIVMSLLLNFVLQTKAATPPAPTTQLHSQLEAFYELIKL
jgi:hypothetical protein